MREIFPWHFESIISLSSDMIVAFEKSAISLIVIPLEVKYHFCLVPFQTLSFYHNVSIHSFLCICPTLNLL